MPHTLELSADLSGSGVLAAAVSADVMWITVTDRGAAREMDVGTPPRLFQLGWVAIGESIPEAGPPVYGYMTPIWIEFDVMCINVSNLVDFSGGSLDFDVLRYELLGGAEVHIAVYTFS